MSSLLTYLPYPMAYTVCTAVVQRTCCWYNIILTTKTVVIVPVVQYVEHVLSKPGLRFQLQENNNK